MKKVQEENGIGIDGKTAKLIENADFSAYLHSYVKKIFSSAQVCCVVVWCYLNLLLLIITCKRIDKMYQNGNVQVIKKMDGWIKVIILEKISISRSTKSLKKTFQLYHNKVLKGEYLLCAIYLSVNLTK